MKRDKLTREISPCCSLTYSQMVFIIKNAVFANESDRGVVLSSLDQRGRLTKSEWIFFACSVSYNPDSTINCDTMKDWLICRPKPNCSQLKLFIESIDLGDWTPELDFPNPAISNDLDPEKVILTGNTITNIIDQYTKEFLTASETNDTNQIDGIIYFDFLNKKYKRNFNNVLNVKWFGAKGDYSTLTELGTNDTAAIQKCIKFAASLYEEQSEAGTRSWANRPCVVDFPTSLYRINGTILIPSGIIVKGNKSQLIGNGNSESGNDIFRTGYINESGNLVSNVGTLDQRRRVIYTTVKDFIFTKCYLGFEMWNFNENSRFENCFYLQCRRGFTSQNSFYSTIIGHWCRDYGFSTSPHPAFHFKGNNNIIGLRDISVSDRTLAYQFDGATNGQSLFGLGVEGCGTGIKFTGLTGPITIDGCYFEAISGTAILANEPGINILSMTIRGSWFANVAKIATIDNVKAGEFCSSNFVGYNTTHSLEQFVKVSNTDGLKSKFKLKIPKSTEPIYNENNDGLLNSELPAKYVSSPETDVDDYKIIQRESDGIILMKSKYSKFDYVVPMQFTGDSGFVPNRLPFVDVEPQGTVANYKARLTTNIKFSEYTFTVFKIRIANELGAINVAGRTYGSTVVLDLNELNKTVVADNNGGKLRLTIGDFVGDAAMIIIPEGIIRHV